LTFNICINRPIVWVEIGWITDLDRLRHKKGTMIFETYKS
jgi:hypothetical protein